MRSPAARAMGRYPFHVVDLVAHVGLEQHRPVDQRARPDVGEMQAAQPHRDAAAQQREPPLQQQDVAARQHGAIADVEIVEPLHREIAGRRAADQEGLEIAGGIEPALGKRDQGAGELRPARGEGERFEALVVGQRRDAGRGRDQLARARTPDFAKSKRTMRLTRSMPT